MEGETQLLAPLGNILGFCSKINFVEESLDRIGLENDVLDEMEGEESSFSFIKETETETSKVQESISSSRHSTPIYQMLERIENKVYYKISSK